MLHLQQKEFRHLWRKQMHTSWRERSEGNIVFGCSVRSRRVYSGSKQRNFTMLDGSNKQRNGKVAALPEFIAE